MRFRFRIGTDDSVEDYGWFIDDIEIYHCEGEEPPPPPPPPPPTEMSSAAPIAPPATQGPTIDPCPAAHAALVRAQAKVAKLRQKLRSMHPPTAAARKAARKAAANVRKKRAAARKACGH